MIGNTTYNTTQFLTFEVFLKPLKNFENRLGIYHIILKPIMEA